MIEYDMIDSPTFNTLSTAERCTVLLIRLYDGTGQGCWRSAQYLADRVGVSRRQMLRILKHLESEGIISAERSSKTSKVVRRVTIDFTSDTSDTNNTASDIENTQLVTPMSPLVTPMSPELVTPMSPKKNSNKTIKKTIKYTYTPEFEEFWKLYPKNTEKRQAFKQWKDIDPELWDEIHEGLMAYRTYIQQENVSSRYIKAAHRWLRDERWHDRYSSLSNGRGLADRIREKENERQHTNITALPATDERSSRESQRRLLTLRSIASIQR